MGIRFACHVCEKRLNIKQELAGRRGICPACSAKFRIPLEDSDRSLPVDVKLNQTATASTAAPSIPNQPASPAIEQRSEEASVAVQDAPVLENPITPVQSPAPNLDIDVLTADPDATWYVRPPNGGQYGPASGIVLKQWIGEGRVAANALLWRDGWPHWRDAKEVLPEIAGQLPQPDVLGNSFEATDQRAPARPETQAATDFAAAEPAEYNGQASVGAERRARSSRRVMMIGVLSAVAVVLVGALILIVNR